MCRNDVSRIVRIISVVLPCLTSPAFAQQASKLSQLPYASTPLSGSELLYTVQNGVSSKTTVGALSAFNALPVVQVSADRTGVQSACPGVQAAINAVQALPNGGTILFPQGVFNMASCGMAISNRNIRIEGAGIGVSELLFTGAANSGGINIHQSSSSFNTMVDHLSIQTSTNQNNTSAITVIYPGGNQLGVIALFDTLDIGGVENVETSYWNIGIYCSACSQGAIRDSVIQGVYNLVGGEMGTSTMLRGVDLTGTSSNQFTIDHSQFFNMQYAVYVDGDEESLSFVDGSSAVGVNYGIFFPDQGTNLPGFHLIGSDYACFIQCIHLTGWQQGTIAHNTIYKRPESTQNFNAIYLVNGSADAPAFSIIDDNVFVGFKGTATGTATVIFMDTNVSAFDIHDNEWRSFDYFLDANPASSTVNYIHDNTWSGTPTPTGWQTGANYHNVMYRNFPAITTTDSGFCAATGAAPNISGGLVCNDFLLSQSGAVNVTSLANGYPGQVAVISPTDGNSTYVQGAGLLLANGVNYTAQNGDVSAFLYDSASGWREIARLAATTINGVKCWPGLSCTITSAAQLQLTPVSIATLLAITCNSGSKGNVAFVSDTTGSAAAAFHSAVAGSGATTVNSLVSCNGTNWQYD